MKHCRVLSASKTAKLGMLVVMLPTSLMSLAAGVYMLLSIPSADYASLSNLAKVLVVSIAALLYALITAVLCVRCLKMESRKYAVTKTGIKLSDKKKSDYTWSEIYEVAIIAYGASASLQSYQTVICIFLKPKMENNLRKLLKSYWYGAFYLKRFVIIDYTPTVENQFAAFYPGEIMDYRKKQLGMKT